MVGRQRLCAVMRADHTARGREGARSKEGRERVSVHSEKPVEYRENLDCHDFFSFFCFVKREMMLG